MPSRQHLWLALLLLVATAIHLPVVTFEFAGDDLARFEAAPRELSSPLDAFSIEGRPESWIYRPTATFYSDAAERIASWIVPDSVPADDARRAPPLHALSLLLHLVAIGLVFAFAGRCLRGRPGAAFGALAAGAVFALHPVHIENVAWISAPADTLATILLLGAFLSFLSGREQGRASPYALSALLFALALFAKEIALPGLALFWLQDWFFPRELTARHARDRAFLVGLCVVAALFLMLRLAAHPSPGPTAQPGAPLSFENIPAALAFYVRKIFFPWPHSPFIPVFPGPLSTLLWGGLGLLGIGGAVIAARKGDRLPLFCAAWFSLTLLPSLSVAVLPLEPVVLAERFLYLPSVGFALGVGALAGRLWEGGHRKALATALGGLLALYALAALQGEWVWRSQSDLMTTITQREESRGHRTGWRLLALDTLARGNLDEAERLARRSLSPDLTSFAQTEVYEIAFCHALLGQIVFLKATASDPGDDPAEQARRLAMLREAEREIRIAGRYLDIDKTLPGTVGRLLAGIRFLEERLGPPR